jgi:hypothetical protein
MAPACWRGAGWVLARPLRQPAPGTAQTLRKPEPERTLPRPRLSSAARRRPARSSSPLRGCGRSSRTPPARRRDPGQLPGRSRRIVRPTPADTTQVTGSKPHALLTPVVLMGAADGTIDRGGLQPCPTQPYASFLAAAELLRNRRGMQSVINTGRGPHVEVAGGPGDPAGCRSLGNVADGASEAGDCGGADAGRVPVE